MNKAAAKEKDANGKEVGIGLSNLENNEIDHGPQQAKLCLLWK